MKTCELTESFFFFFLFAFFFFLIGCMDFG